jgi:hypothetical protein
VTEFLDVWLAAAGAAHLTAVALLALFGVRDRLPAWIGALFVYGAACLVGVWAGGSTATSIGIALAFAVAGAAITVATRTSARGLSIPGSLVWVTLLIFTAVSSAWGAAFLFSLDVSPMTKAALVLTALLVIVALPSSVVQTYEGWEAALRVRWRRAKDPLAMFDGVGPRVSIHVPIHEEPPDVVIATLNRLASLDYANFEVLVIDNNTSDESLWAPVRDRCYQLGPAFRFFHIEGIAGAKAGALNFALGRTDPAAELVGVVDADYQVDSDWLARTVGYFENPWMGFVQCPHAYRDFEHSRFGRMANIEYKVFFDTSMVSYNERGAALTVGTMSLIKRSALEHVGGWSTWCLTEDSELSIRIHAAGYLSVYLSRPMGRGLIPDTFAGYRRQRFRWTYGPVQELRAHARLFLPQRIATPSALSTPQRVHHGNHGLDVAMISARFLALPAMALAAASMVAHKEVVGMPFALWIASTCLVVSSVAMRFIVGRRCVGASIPQILASLVAYLSLGLTIQIASLKSLLGRPATWQRTSKFESQPNMKRALRATLAETVLGVACLTVAATGFVLVPERGIAMMILIGIAVLGLSYLTAPIVAVIADLDLRTIDLANVITLPDPSAETSSEDRAVQVHG